MDGETASVVSGWRSMGWTLRKAATSKATPKAKARLVFEVPGWSSPNPTGEPLLVQKTTGTPPTRCFNWRWAPRFSTSRAARSSTVQTLPRMQVRSTLMRQHQLHRTVSDTDQQFMVTRFAAFPTHGQLSAAKGSSTTVSRSDVRLIQHLDSSALGSVQRYLFIGYFAIHLLLPLPRA